MDFSGFATIDWRTVSALGTITAICIALFFPGFVARQKRRQTARFTRVKALTYLRILDHDLHGILHGETGVEPERQDGFLERNRGVINSLENFFTLASENLSLPEQAAMGDFIFFLRTEGYRVGPGRAE